VKAVLLNLLSVGGAFGLTVLVFQHGYGGRFFGLEGPPQAIWAVVPVLCSPSCSAVDGLRGVSAHRRQEVFDKTGRVNAPNVPATLHTISAALVMCVRERSMACPLRPVLSNTS